MTQPPRRRASRVHCHRTVVLSIVAIVLVAILTISLSCSFYLWVILPCDHTATETAAHHPQHLASISTGDRRRASRVHGHRTIVLSIVAILLVAILTISLSCSFYILLILPCDHTATETAAHHPQHLASISTGDHHRASCARSSQSPSYGVDVVDK